MKPLIDLYAELFGGEHDGDRHAIKAVGFTTSFTPEGQRVVILYGLPVLRTPVRIARLSITDIVLGAATTFHTFLPRADVFALSHDQIERDNWIVTVPYFLVPDA